MLRPNEPLGKGLSIVYDLLVLSILYLVTTLPVITVGVATIALYENVYAVLELRDGVLFKDYFLMLRGTVQPRRYNDKEFEVRFKGMVQLHEVLSSVREMSLTIDLETLTPEFIQRLTDTVAAARKVKKAEATTDLKVRVVDSHTGVTLAFLSKGKKMKVTPQLADLCEEFDIKFVLQ